MDLERFKAALLDNVPEEQRATVSYAFELAVESLRGWVPATAVRFYGDGRKSKLNLWDGA